MKGLLAKYQTDKTEKQLLFELALSCFQKSAFSRSLQYLDEAITLEGVPAQDEIIYLQSLNLKQLRKTEQAILQVAKLVFITNNDQLKEEGFKLFKELIEGFNTKDSLKKIVELILGKVFNNNKQLINQGLNLLMQLTAASNSNSIFKKIANLVFTKGSIESANPDFSDIELLLHSAKDQWHTIEKRELLEQSEFQEKIEQIKIQLHQYKYKYALDLIEEVTQEHPDSKEVLLLKIRAMIEGQIDLEKGRSLFEDIHYGYMSIISQPGELDKLLNLIINEKPERGNNYFFAAFVGLNTGIERKQIEQWIEQGEKLGLQTGESNPEKGLFQLKGDFYKLADPVLSASAYFDAGKRYYWDGNYEKAIKLFSWCNELNINLKEAFYYLSDAVFLQSIRSYPPYFDKRMLEEAYTTWHKAGPPKVQTASEAWPWFSLARIHDARYSFTKENFANEYWNAVLNGEKALLYDASNLFFLGQHAKFLRNIGLYQNSNLVLEKAQLFSKTDPAIEEERIINLIDTGQYDEPWKWLQAKREELKTEYPQYYKLWEGYILFYDRKDISRARALFDEVIKEAQANMFAREMKLFIELHGSQFSAAQEAAKAILSLYNENEYPKDFFAYAWAHLVMGDTEKAINIQKSVEKAGGAYVNQGFSLVPFYMAAGKTQLAAEKLLEYIDQNLKAKDLIDFRDNLQMVSGHIAGGNFGIANDPDFIHSFTREQVEKINQRIDNILSTPPNAITELVNEENELKKKGGSSLHLTTLAFIKARVLTQNKQYNEAEETIHSIVLDAGYTQETLKLLETLHNSMDESIGVALKAGDYSKIPDAIPILERSTQVGEYYQLLRSYYTFHAGDALTASGIIKIILQNPASYQLIEKFIKDLTDKFYKADDTWTYGLLLFGHFEKVENDRLKTAFIEFWNNLLNKYENPQVSVTTPIAIDVSTNLVPPEAGTDDWDVLTKHIPAMRENIASTYGVRPPGVRIRDYGEGLEDNSFFYSLENVPILLETVPSYETKPFDFIISALEKFLTKNLSLYTDYEYCHYYLTNNLSFITEAMEPATKEAAETIKGNRKAFIQFKKVICVLASEKFSLSPRSRIIELFNSAPQECADTSDFVQHIRENMKEILWQHNKLENLIKLDQETEDKIEIEFDSIGGKKFLAMVPENCQQVLNDIRDQLSDYETKIKEAGDKIIHAPILQVKNSHLRYHIKKLIELEFPDVAVVSEKELIN